ncbi:hypothetical protein BCIN_08g01970 [Botrytis cinerea B05.10]|uniref:Uncharacterized protein n=2 Tax=Botryotinia fuckeliana (strain B05.10) TaxID=332648 RepID=A0A384JQ53_BOTFB|nr:hypothetical protein BCIN_08g01970 [Botrytis cinerea B05.10]ATZ52494.1 hypothetical protein BCIN_08g01970 [Botrytis cinerea B05.10]
MPSASPEDIHMLAVSKNAMNPKGIPYKAMNIGSHEFYSTPEAAVTETRGSVQRGVSWHKQPTYMVLFAFLGIALAFTHHGYYSHLDGKQGTNNFQKQFSVTLGSLLAFSVVSSFLAANSAAYPQYLWMSIRNKAFTLSTLDKMFALTSDPMGFMSVEIFRHAPVVALLALVYWAMSLAAILPPGTLIIVNGLADKTSNVSVPTINWSIANAFQEDNVSTVPGTVIINIGRKAAESSDIVSIEGPAPNSYYSLDIRGPYVQCMAPNDTEKIYFDQYVEDLAQNNIFTSTSWTTHYQNASTLSDSLVSPWPSMAYLSAFDPWMYPGNDSLGWLRIGELDTSSPDQSNNWDVSIRRNISADLSNTNNKFFSVQPKLWVLTANDSFVYGLVNGTRNVHFNFIDGTQHISYGVLYDVEDVNMLWTNVPGYPGSLGNTRHRDIAPYVSLYQSMISMLSGNITAQIDTSDMSSLALNTVRFGLPSCVLSTGLAGCDDFLNAYWNDNPLVGNADCLPAVRGTTGHCVWRNAYTAFNISRLTNIYNSTEFFTKPASACRNHSLARGIEDLAANITISLFSEPKLLKQNAMNVPVTFTHSINVFSYSPRYLYLLYGIATFFSCLGTILGLYAFYANGVVHSTALSAIIATTRNRISTFLRVKIFWLKHH